MFDVNIVKKENIWNSYVSVVNKLKRMTEEERLGIMQKLRSMSNVDLEIYRSDFGMLSWKQVLEMKDSGIFDFGIHTATHKILTSMGEEQWEAEIKKPKERLSEILNKDVISMCYPNGIPVIDFNDKHIEYLKECGFICAFTTDESLYDPQKNTPFQISRIPACNDFTSHKSYFRMSTSGFLD